MAMEGPEIVVIWSETGRFAALSPMMIALPRRKWCLWKQEKRMGPRVGEGPPNQEATMRRRPWRALGEG